MAKRSIADSPAAAPAGNGAEWAEQRTLIERAYVQLRDDIVEGALRPGEKLRVEHLKLRYSVGAGTLREAITRLVSDALVVAEGQRGFRVTAMTIDDLQDLTELRLHIEIDALRRSVREGDDAWRARLERAYAELAELEQPIASARRKDWEAANVRFHEELVSGHRSPWTQRTLRLLSRHGERYRRWSIDLPSAGRDVHAEHEQIYRAALAGQEARAALALEAHVRTTMDLLVEAWGEGKIELEAAREAGAAPTV